MFSLRTMSIDSILFLILLDIVTAYSLGINTGFLPNRDDTTWSKLNDYIVYVIPPVEDEPDPSIGVINSNKIINVAHLEERVRKVQNFLTAMTTSVQSEYEVGEDFFAFHVKATLDEMTLFSKSRVSNSIKISKNYKYIKSSLQRNAWWHLERISNTTFNKNKKYYYSENAGNNTDVYVFDTGIQTDLNKEFEGRARQGASFVEATAQDPSGHGTAIAGLIASKSFGVAKKASLISVQILDAEGVGWTSTFLSGLTYVSNQIKQAEAADPSSPKRSSIINMSVELDDPRQDIYIDTAISSIVAMGVPVVAASGNHAKDACTLPVARNRDVLTVGSTDVNDRITDFSGFGRCVNLFAPGEAMYTFNQRGENIEEFGTSTSAAIVTGIAALVLSEVLLNITNTRHLYQFIVQGLAARNILKTANSKNSFNVLAQNGGEDLKDMVVSVFEYNFDLPICPWWKCWWNPNCKCTGSTI